MTALVPITDMRQMAEAVCKSNLFGIKTPDQALALMLIAQAEGLHPAVAARDYHIIQGRPALKADAMLARFQAAGGKVEWPVYTDLKVTGRFSHPQGGSMDVTWTLEQARQIGLTSKENWRNYPRAMLRSRVISEGIRTVYPGVISGTYTPDEIENIPEEKTKTIDVGASQDALDVPAEPVAEGIPLRLPSGKPHSFHTSTEDWVDAYKALLSRIRTSTKLEPATREEMVTALKEMNDEVMGTLSETDLENALYG